LICRAARRVDSSTFANDWERNVLLFRNKTAAQIHQLAKDCLLHLKSNGVKKFIVSIGTVDLINLPFGYKQPQEVATQVAASISAIQQDLGIDCQLCVVTTGPNSRVPYSAYTQFINQLLDQLDKKPQ